MTFAARITARPTIEKRRTCNNCGRLGHLITTCTNHERHHDKVGIEIEGWWYDLIAAQAKARDICGHAGTRDGSIRDISSCDGSDQDDPVEDPDVEDCEEGCDDCPHPIERRSAPRCSRGKTNCKACGARGWEFQTRPGSVGEALRQLTALYPDVTSRAAGMHVHMSFKEKTSVSLLCSDNFFAYWKQRWEAWGTKNNVQGAFWERLRNENQYCRPNDITSDYGHSAHPKKANIVSAHAQGRYKAVNFAAYEEHSTVEFRLLPMFQKGNLAVNAVETLVDIVETYLQNVVLDESYESPPTKLPKSKDEAVEMEPVNLDMDIPNPKFDPVTCELDMVTEKPVMGHTESGTVRMFRYQVADFYSRAASEAQNKLAQIADPKRNGVVWSEFNPDPEVR